MSSNEGCTVHLLSAMQRALTPFFVDRNLVVIIASIVVAVCLYYFVSAVYEYARVTSLLSQLPGPKNPHWVRPVHGYV